jgi:hypothetical protein
MVVLKIKVKGPLCINAQFGLEKHALFSLLTAKEKSDFLPPG